MGVKIEIRGADETVARMQELAAALNQPLRPLFETIAEEWITEFKANIRNQGDSSGAFTPLTPYTQRARKAAGYGAAAPILERTGNLIGENGLRTLLMTDESLSVGSDLEYAALQHFGGRTSPQSLVPDRPVPARPFVSLSDVALTDTLEMIEAYFFPEPGSGSDGGARA